ncbi:MAG: PQQ-dependent sugar dehydrogenase, partial [Bacteroidia bacterium]|nr:PQQ-dependent sugar dehydrogenase [Bacteroidia bacterium]
IEVIGEEEYLFTDRTGAFYHYLNGSAARVTGIPGTATTTFSGIIYGGLMDVSLHPNYETNNWIYITYVNNAYNLSVARFKLVNNKAEDLEVIYSSDQFSIGSRIAWQDDTHFFLSIGVGGSPYPDPGPQNLSNVLGKIHRFMEDGQIPADNPVFVGESGPISVWTYGHRNPQGFFYDPATNIFYANEHGPLGGDELNIIEKGGNYGWPLFSYGLNYDGTPVSDMTEEEAADSTVLPLKAWTTSFRISPSGLIKLKDSNFPEWNGSFLMGSLLGRDLVRYDPDTDVTDIVLENIGRVRDIAQVPSGDLLILIDEGSPTAADKGRIIRLRNTE